jgi:hypothetical protein
MAEARALAVAGHGTEQQPRLTSSPDRRHPSACPLFLNDPRFLPVFLQFSST